MGMFNGWDVVDKFGHNPDVDSTWVEVWIPDSIFHYPITAELLDIQSTSFTDDDGDTGAHKIELEGLDGNYNVQTEEVTLDGTTPVLTAKTWLRVHRVRVIESGTPNALQPAGSILVSGDDTLGTYSVVAVGAGQSQQALYTIPAGKTGYFEKCHIATDTSNIISAQLQVRPLGEAWQTKHETSVVQGHINFDMSGSGAIAEKSDIRWIAKGDNPNNAVSAGFKIMLEERSSS
jgi:hypothetical protein